MSKPTYRRGKLYAKRAEMLLLALAQSKLRDKLSEEDQAIVQMLGRTLTPRQLQCLSGYYCRRLGLYDMAQELGIRPSTVSRHIMVGHNKLDQAARYAAEGRRGR